jgi:hypothetical protein
MTANEYIVKTQFVMWSAMRYLVFANLEQCPDQDCARCTELLEIVRWMDQCKGEFENVYGMFNRKAALPQSDRAAIDALIDKWINRHECGDWGSLEERDVEWSLIQSEIIAAEERMRGVS